LISLYVYLHWGVAVTDVSCDTNDVGNIVKCKFADKPVHLEQ